MPKISIDIRQLPAWFQGSPLLETSVNNNWIVDIDDQYYTDISTISTDAEFWHVIVTMRFWCITTIPFFVLDYLLDRDSTEPFGYDTEFGQLITPFIGMNDDNLLWLAIEGQNIYLLDYAIYRRATTTPTPTTTTTDNINKHHNDIWQVFHTDFPTIHCLAVHGTPEFLDAMCDRGFVDFVFVITESIVVGNLPLAIACIDTSAANTDDDINILIRLLPLCKLAAEHGQLECLQWVHTNGYRWASEVCEAAAENGHLPCLKYAHENGCMWDNDILISALKHNNRDCFFYAYTNDCPDNHEVRSIDLAIGRGWIECLEYLVNCNRPLPDQSCIIAAIHGHLDCLIYAHTNGVSMTDYVCDVAAMNGNISCLQYAHMNGCTITETTYRYAVIYGHVVCAEYVHNIVFPVVCKTY